MTLRFDLGVTRGCGPDCPAFVERWGTFWDQQARDPVAVIRCDGYLDSLSRNARKLARRAQRRYQFREFEFNKHRGAIQAINTSKLETSQGPTHGWFRRAVQPQPALHLCGVHREIWFGGFDEKNVMRGYWSIARLGTLGTSVWLFKHAEGSEYVLNGLAAHIAEHGNVDYVSYHRMDAEPHTGRPEFKRRIGCQEARLVFT